MKKAIDQTVRDLKRGVNKKVLKVPLIEQKVLDATSNEPWGPHGTLLADIAQASRNSYEYQMMMSIIWKRLNDTGKNWRHVYKALTVLEYLVAHGSERVIEEIREHSYQIQTLSDFQYIDSSGRDQGNNVRKKSQTLVVLVNDKERIIEVRQKAAANRDKFQSSSAGSMYRPGSRERFDDRYGSRDEERNGYGKERESSYRDDDRYGKYGDSYSRDGDRYSREYDDRDRYRRDDDYRRRSPSVEGSQYGSRSRSSDRDRDRSYEDDGQYSSRGGVARSDDQAQDQSASGGKLDRKYSEQNLSAPPSYEDAVGGVEAVGSAHSSTHSDREGETSAGAPKPSIPSASSSPPQAPGTAATSPAPAPRSSAPPAVNNSSAAPPVNNKEADGFNEFDPRGTAPTSPTDNSLALVPTSEVDSTNSASGAPTQGFSDPFGDGPFKATHSTDDAPDQKQSFHSVPSQNTSNSGAEPPQQASQNSAMVTFNAATSTSSGDPNIDMLADIFPLSGHQHPVISQPDYSVTVNQGEPQSGQIVPSTFSSSGDPQAHQSGFPGQSGQMNSLPYQQVPQTAFYQGGGPTAHQTSFPVQPGHPSSIHGFPAQSGQLVMHPDFSSQFRQSAPQPFFPGHNGQPSSLSAYGNQSAHPNAVPYGNYNMQSGGQNMVPEVSSTPTLQQNATNFHAPPQPFQAPQAGSSVLMASQSSGYPTPASVSTAPPAKDKFETKSSVWTDTLSRGLVNLNISGPKTNPLSDIGVDFDALNRKDKRMEKPSANPVTSTVHMGKAMGSGSGIGRAGAGGLRPTSNPMMGAGVGMGMAGPRPGVGMAGYGGMNQQSMGGGMGMNMAPNMGMGMGMNMGMGAQMQRPMGFPPGSNMQGGYNPMMGTGNYGHNQYGSGYR